jgi:hypothetical protein
MGENVDVLVIGEHPCWKPRERDFLRGRFAKADSMARDAEEARFLRFFADCETNRKTMGHSGDPRELVSRKGEPATYIARHRFTSFLRVGGGMSLTDYRWIE